MWSRKRVENLARSASVSIAWTEAASCHFAGKGGSANGFRRRRGVRYAAQAGYVRQVSETTEARPGKRGVAVYDR